MFPPGLDRADRVRSGNHMGDLYERTFRILSSFGSLRNRPNFIRIATMWFSTKHIDFGGGIVYYFEDSVSELNNDEDCNALFWII